MKVLSLFAGIGGIDLAAAQVGMETVAFCEIDPFCQKVLNKHWPQVPIYDDVRTITKQQLEQDGVIDDDRAISIVVGGFPCQPFSVAGKQRGKEDDRHLWPEMLRVIKELRPTWVLGENVTGLVRLGLDDVIADLENEGYTARTFIVPASAVGAPHRRDRVWIVAHTASSQCKSGAKEQTALSEMHADGGKYDHSSGSSETCEYVADSCGIGCNNGCNHRQKRSIQNEHKGTNQKDKWQRNRWFSGIGSNGQTVADTNSPGQQECNVTTIAEKQRFNPWQANGSEENGSTQSRLSGELNEFSARLDGHKWPAFLGQEQFDWEAPRVATGVKDRKNRLQALGNSVVPAQVYPILKAIMKAEAMS